jgi:hypothetical protein
MANQENKRPVNPLTPSCCFVPNSPVSSAKSFSETMEIDSPMHNSPVGFGIIGLFSLMLVAPIGCGDGGEAKYIPSETTAREALEVALTAWKEGKSHGTITSWNTPIDAYDARWRDGKKLEAFEVVREEMLEEKKAFVVKMKLVDEKEQEVTYLVIGNNPLMVFRREDYEKASGMGGG